MRTRKTISNISYNTPEFFEHTIKRLYNDGVIEWCYWILHKADTDETKDHIHFVLRPSDTIDTKALQMQFVQIDPNNVKPLCVTSKWNFTNSMDDWLLYAVHDMGYLASKGQRRNYRYEKNDIKSTDYDALNNDWNAINHMKFDRLRILSEAVESHVPFALLVQQGVIPISQRAQFEAQYHALRILQDADLSGRNMTHEDTWQMVDEDGVIHETPKGFYPLSGSREEQIDFEEVKK